MARTPPIRAFVHLADGRTPEGTRVGAVAQIGRRITFQYAPEYIARGGMSISPILLPIASRVYEFPELRNQIAFHGLPGVLADSLPDRFGNRLIEAYFQQHGTRPEQLSPVQKLLYVGRRAMGALTYQPALPIDSAGMREAVTLERLREQAKRIIEGHVDEALPEIMAAASTAGGMRAKALVFWNRKTNAVAIGASTPDSGYEPWLVKFDGADPNGERHPFTRMEFAYNEMARAAGMSMPDSCLIDAGGFRHFAVKRFDRTPDGGRVHVHSLCGLQHIDYNLPQAAGYELLLQSCLDLYLGAGALKEAFRRMAFNVIACNQDDHTKNVAFVMDSRSGLWDLAPAYDITYAKGNGWTATHQMTINGKDSGLTRADLLAVASRFDVDDANAIIDQVIDVVSNWRRFAKAADLPAAWIDRIEGDHETDLPPVKPLRMTAG